MLDLSQSVELGELQSAQYEVVVQHPRLGIIRIGRVVIDSGDLRPFLEVHPHFPKLFEDETQAEAPA